MCKVISISNQKGGVAKLAEAQEVTSPKIGRKGRARD